MTSYSYRFFFLSELTGLLSLSRIYTENRKERHRIRITDSAFSLVELLIVVGIVGVLVAVLLPAFSRINEKSGDVNCLANLRTLSLASLNYIRDNSGRLFPSKYWYSPSWDSSPGMRDYVISSTSNRITDPEFQRDTVFTCRVLKGFHPQKYPSYLNRNYSANWLAFENNPANGSPADERPKRIFNIPSLSQMWLFTDGCYTSATGKDAYGVWLRRKNLGADTAAQLAFPHTERQNTVFFDGHVERLSRDDFYNPKSIRLFWGELTARD